MRGPVNASDPDGGRVLLCMRAAANHSVAISPAFLDDEGNLTTQTAAVGTARFFLFDVRLMISFAVRLFEYISSC